MPECGKCVLTISDGTKFTGDGLAKRTRFLSATFKLAIGAEVVLMRATFDKSAATEMLSRTNTHAHTNELHNAYLHAYGALISMLKMYIYGKWKCCPYTLVRTLSSALRSQNQRQCHYSLFLNAIVKLFHAEIVLCTVCFDYYFLLRRSVAECHLQAVLYRARCQPHRRHSPDRNNNGGKFAATVG